MRDPKKTDDPLPKEIQQQQNKWLKSCNSTSFSIFQANFGSILFFVLTTLLTTLGIGYIQVITTNISGYNYMATSKPVNKTSCKCDCWDGFYRGVHPKESNGTSYKRFYFNYDQDILKIVFIFLLYAQMFKICFSKIINLILHDLGVLFGIKNGNRSLRIGILLAFLVNVYSNFYASWNLINYINDAHYRTFRLTIYLALNEFILGYVYYQCLDKYDIKSGSYIPIPLSLSFPVLMVSFTRFYIYSPDLLSLTFWRDLNYHNSDHILQLYFVCKDALGLLFGFIVWISVRRPLYSNISKSELAGKGYLLYAIIWTLIGLGIHAAKKYYFDPKD